MSESLLNKILKSDCHKIPWSYHLFVENNHLRVEKRISVWTKEGQNWTRHFFLPIPLEWTVCYLENGREKKAPKNTFNNYVSVTNNTVFFNGGYLSISDPGLIKPLWEEARLLLGDNDVKESLSRAKCPSLFLFPLEETDSRGTEPGAERVERLLPPGRNIHVEVDIDRISGVGYQPLFYFPQEDNVGKLKNLGSVYLALSNKTTSQETFFVTWTISNQAPFKSAPFILKKGETKMTLIASQDSNWTQPRSTAATGKPSGISAYFEILIDAIGLHPDEENSAVFDSDSKVATNLINHKDKTVDHPFGLGARTFCVGYAPDNPADSPGTLTGPGERLFRGAISRLVFDPNSHCPECSP